MALMVEAEGGHGGTQWDDGFDYEGVTKIHVQGGREGIQYIKLDYAKAGKIIAGPIHGVDGCGYTVQPFEINHSEKEYLLSVEGCYDKSTGVIQSIQFKTNKKTSALMGCKDGTKFSLIAASRIIIGFHGFADKNLNSLGAYFIRDPSLKSEMEGGQTTCKGYDHGGDYDGIRKVYVTFDDTAIRHLRVDYDKAGQVKSHEHGVKIGTQHEYFEVKYPYEYITSVEGSYAVTNPYGCIVLRSLTFKTSNGRTSPIIGTVTGTEFVLKSEGNVIVGFHGWVGGSCVESIGAYYAPFVPSPLLPEKREAHGGDGGDSWDDGSFKNVKKIYIGHGHVGIVSVKFEYENDSSEVVVGDEHGNTSDLGYDKPFELDPSEYITSVEARHDKVKDAETGVITMLRFKTNKGTSKAFGLEADSRFDHGKEGHKITGFHGKSSSGVRNKITGKLESGVLHKIGVYVIPITE